MPELPLAGGRLLPPATGNKAIPCIGIPAPLGADSGVPPKKKKAMFTPGQKIALLIGFGLILAAAGFIGLIWLGMLLPGFAGEVFQKMAGLMWTPVILDASLFLIGLILVLWLNIHIRARDGDEYVYLEQVEAPTSDLPEGARAVIFNEAPAPRGIEPSLAAIEGALELDDLSEATTLLYELPVERLEDPEVLALRIELSRRRGHDKKAAELREQLRLKSPQHPLAGGEGSEIPGR